MQSPDPGISLATMFSTKAPATPAAAPPKRADGPSFEDSLSKAENRPDRVRPTDRSSRPDESSRAETASRVDRRDKPTETREATEPTTDTRNEVRDVESRPEDRVSEYARARLLISQPATESQEPTEVVPVVDSQPSAEIGEQPKLIDVEAGTPQLPEGIEETDEPIFSIQPWPLNSMTEEPLQIRPINLVEAESTDGVEPTIELSQHADALPRVETEIVTQPEVASGDLKLAVAQAAVIPTQTESQQAAVVPDTQGETPTTAVVVPVTEVSTPSNATVAVPEPDIPVQTETSQVVPASVQQSETATEPQSNPVFERPVEPQATAEHADSPHPTEAQPKPFEPAGRAAVDLTDQSSVAESADADPVVQAALPVQPRATQGKSTNAGNDVTSVARRAVDAALATAGVAVTAIDEAGDSGSSGTGSQDLDSQAFSSLLQAQAQITQASRGQRASRQIDVNPTQFAEMPAEIVAKARNLADNETAELEIQLDPPELGQLKIQLRRVDGEVAARITVTDPAAFELLQHELQELRENLQQSDVAFSSVDVEQDQQNRQSFDRERSGSFAREDSEPTTREAVAPQPTGSSQQTIDIRV